MALTNVQYIVFDLNGTLVVEDYLRHDEVLDRIFNYRRKGRRLTTQDLREVSKGERPLSELIARLYIVDDPEAACRRLLNFQAARINFREKALEVLLELRKKYKLLLGTDTTGIAKAVVKKLSISKYFVSIFYSCDVGYLKSEEGFWTNLLSHFPESNSQDFLIVGDNPRADIYHPKRFGMHTMLIENLLTPSFDYRDPPTGSDEEKPEYYIKKLEEILPLFGIKDG